MEEIPTMEAKSLEHYTTNLIQERLGVKPDSIETLGMSIGGSVMKVETEKGMFVVKLIANEAPADLNDEDVSERVYGGRWTEFEPAYDAMKIANLPLPTIHSTGYTEDGSHYYILMDYLAGESVREYVATVPDDEALHNAVGSMFGKLHTVTRNYQGWASMESPYEKTWGEAFFAALENQITEIESHAYLAEEETKQLRVFANKYQSEWIEPKEFVLSHLDGFQGIAAKHENVWSVDGIIDIEDHQFTDQRFVLCGHELAMETEGYKLPDSFWYGYKIEKEIDPTFEQFVPLFKLYYLSVWLCVFKDKSIGDIPDRKIKVENTINMIRSLLSA